MAIPVLPSLLSSRVAKAAAGFSPKRFVTWSIPNGFPQENWLPRTKAGTNLAAEVRSHRLESIAGGISPILDNIDRTLLNQINFVLGLDSLGIGQHGQGHLLSGVCVDLDEKFTHETLDVILARNLYAVEPRQRLLCASASNYGHMRYHTSFKKSGSSIAINPEIQSPAAIFSLLFTGLRPPQEPMVPQKPPALTRSILDYVLQDYLDIKRSVSSDDRTRLDEHMTELRALEKRLNSDVTAPSASCAVPTTKYGSKGIFHETSSLAEAEKLIDDYISLFVAAFKCDLVRVISFNTLSGSAPLPAFDIQDFHDLSHYGQRSLDISADYAIRKLTEVHSFFIKKWSQFLVKLKSATDPLNGETVLDQTLAIYGSEFAYAGQNPDSHARIMNTVLTAGSLSGTLNTGNILDYTRDNVPKYKIWPRGVIYNRLLVTILKAMGVSSNLYDTSGFGPIYADQEGNQHYNLSNAAIKTPLPGLLKG